VSTVYELVPLIAIVAIAVALAVGAIAMPKDRSSREVKDMHWAQFRGTTPRAVPAEEEDAVEPAPAKPTWRGLDLSIFDDEV
jgi:hypothetical protein